MKIKRLKIKRNVKKRVAEALNSYQYISPDRLQILLQNLQRTLQQPKVSGDTVKVNWLEEGF